MALIRINKIKNISKLKNICWNGALRVIEKFERANKCRELMNYIKSVYKDEYVSESQLNDFIWFDLENTNFYKDTIGRK